MTILGASNICFTKAFIVKVESITNLFCDFFFPMYFEEQILPYLKNTHIFFHFIF